MAVHRDGDALVFDGVLDRDTATALWQDALRQLDGVRRLELSTVTRLDSAGLALLAELVHRSGGADVHGDPPGLSGLRRAYRLSPNLCFARN